MNQILDQRQIIFLKREGEKELRKNMGREN